LFFGGLKVGLMQHGEQGYALNSQALRPEVLAGRPGKDNES
jgi:hypothetical protein